MKKYIIPLLFLYACLLAGCEKIDTGFLNAVNAYYRPNFMVIKYMLNPNDPGEQHRIENRIPWNGSEISNVQGTAVIYYKVDAVYDSLGMPVAEEIARQFTIIGKGVVEVAGDHTVPVGKYLLDILIFNKDHSFVLKKGFTVIVEGKEEEDPQEQSLPFGEGQQNAPLSGQGRMSGKESFTEVVLANLKMDD